MSLETVETLYTFGPARLRRAGDSSPTTVTSHPDVPYVMLLLTNHQHKWRRRCPHCNRTNPWAELGHKLHNKSVQETLSQ
jgi:hypothetical protein